MEQFISGELGIIIRINFHKRSIGLTIVGKFAWQQEKHKGDISTALMIQEPLIASELFKEYWPFSPALPADLAHPSLPPKHGWLGQG